MLSLFKRTLFNNSITSSRFLYEVMVDEGDDRINYHLIEIKSE